MAIGFKEENTSKDKFNDLHLARYIQTYGRGFMILQKPFISPQACKISSMTLDPLTFSPVEVKIQVP